MDEKEVMMRRAQFSIGDLVQHKLFNYRGVIIDVDPHFQLTEEWYDKVALSRPPKDLPWYHVLVHEGTHSTYVAERNLAADASGGVITHPMVGRYFTRVVDGRYVIDGEKLN